MSYTKSLRLSLMLVSLCLANVGCESDKEAKAKFSAGANAKPFDKIEKNMCGEDVVERPPNWDERRDCNNDGKLFVGYSAEGRDNKCLSLPAVKSYECTAASFIKKMKAIHEFDIELVRLYYASADKEKEFEDYEKNRNAFLDAEIADINKVKDFILNCWEYERHDDVGSYDAIALQAYFPNKATTNEKLGCTLYSDFVNYTPCMRGLKKIKGSGLALLEDTDDPIKKEQKMGDDELISGEEADEANDELLADCLSEN